MRLLDDLTEEEILHITKLVAEFEDSWLKNIEPSMEEINEIQQLENDLSAHYALIRIGATGYVFRATDDRGTIFHKYPNGHESIPFYPARHWLSADLGHEYPQFRAVKMNVDEWTNRYLIPMQDDKLFVELLPQPQNLALLVQPSTASYLIDAIINV